MEYMGMADASAIINGDCCLDKLWIALLSLTHTYVYVLSLMFQMVYISYRKDSLYLPLLSLHFQLQHQLLLCN